MSEFLARWRSSDDAKLPPIIVNANTLAMHRFFAVVDSIVKAASEEKHSDLDWPAAYEGFEDIG